MVGINTEAVLADFGHPALQVHYVFETPQDIAAIQVFAANEVNPGDGRVFQNYDVDYSTDSGNTFVPLATNVSTGSLGRNNKVPTTDPAYIGATRTRVEGALPGPIAKQADVLRFTFRPVANVDGVYIHPDSAYVSSIIKEIDVFGYEGAPPAYNLADIAGDQAVDDIDLARFVECVTGPADAEGEPPALPVGCE